MKRADRLPQGVVRPVIYPTASADIRTLERRRSVPDGLRFFWDSVGSGFFNDDESGRTIVRGVINHLLGPDEVISVLEVAETHEYLSGIPFFEMNDCIYLLIDDAGMVFADDTGVRMEIAGSLDEFIARLVEDPAFYIPLLGEG